jgi:hypothetical protein
MFMHDKKSQVFNTDLENQSAPPCQARVHKKLTIYCHVPLKHDRLDKIKYGHQFNRKKVLRTSWINSLVTFLIVLGRFPPY